jgi:hypothetical protein
MTVRELYQELKDGTRVKLGDNKKARVLKYINFEIERYTTLRDFVRANKGNENYQLENFPEYNHLIRVKQILIGEPDSNFRTFKIEMSPQHLDTIRERLITKGLIDKISWDSFYYLFSWKPVTKTMERLKWKESGPLCHKFLERLIYGNSKFNFQVINKCITLPKGKKLDSNDKSRSQYKEKDMLDPIFEGL